MACKTCDHTMQKVNDGDNPRVFWCPNCGTIKSEGHMPEFAQPRIAKNQYPAKPKSGGQAKG